MMKRRGSGKPAPRRPAPPTTPTVCAPPPWGSSLTPGPAFGREPLGMGCPVFMGAAVYTMEYTRAAIDPPITHNTHAAAACCMVVVWLLYGCCMMLIWAVYGFVMGLHSSMGMGLARWLALTSGWLWLALAGSGWLRLSLTGPGWLGLAPGWPRAGSD